MVSLQAVHLSGQEERLFEGAATTAGGRPKLLKSIMGSSIAKSCSLLPGGLPVV